MSGSQILQTARNTANSDSRPLGIRRHSIPELESFITRHPTKQTPSSHGRGIACESTIAQAAKQASSKALFNKALHISIKLRTFRIKICKFAGQAPVLLTTVLGLLACAHFLLRFASSPIRRVCSLVLHAIVPSLIALPHFLLCFVSSPSYLTRASCNCAGLARPCTLSFMLRQFTEYAHSCCLQLCWACSPVHTFFYASQVRRVCSILLLSTVSGLLAPAQFLLCFVSSPSPLTRASCNCVVPAHPCTLSFSLRKFTEFANSCSMQLCQACSPVHTFFYALQVRRVCSLVLLAIVLGLLARAHFLLCFASSPSLLTCAPCNCAGPTRPCILPFTLRKFAESAHSCFLQLCRACSPVHTLLYASQVRRVCLLVLLATVLGLLARAHYILRFLRKFPPSLLARASCKSAGAARSCTFSFTIPKFLEPVRSCFMQICRACSLLLLATMPGLLARAHFLLCFASSPSHLTRSSCNCVKPARLCRVSFTLPKFAEFAHSCFLQLSQASLPVHISFYASQVSRVTSLVLLATTLGLLARAHSLLCFASSPSLLTRAACNYARPACPCILPFMLCKFAESPHSCFLLSFSLCKFAEFAHSCSMRLCRAFSPLHTFFYASQVRRVCSLALLATLLGLLARAHFLLCFTSSPSLLTRAACNFAGPARPCTLSFMHGKFPEFAHSCCLQLCWACSPVHTFFYASQVRRVCSLVLLATMPGLLARAYFLLCFASSPSHHTRVSCNCTGPARPCTLSFTLPKFSESAESRFLQLCRACSLVHISFYASQVRQVPSLMLLATLLGLLAHVDFLLAFASLLARAHFLLCFACLPSHLTRASCNCAGPARPCTLSFTLSKFAKSAHSCFSQLYRAYSPRAHFLLHFVSSPILLTRASCSCTGPARPMHTSSYASQVRRICSFVLLATVPGLLAFAHFHLRFASSPSLLTRASWNYAGPVCTLSLTLRKFPEPTRSCFLQIHRACSPVHTLFYASQVPQAYSLVLLAYLPGLLARAHSLLSFPSSPELARSCFSQIRWACSSMHTFFYASQVPRAYSFVLFAKRPGLLARAHFLLSFASSPEPTHSCFLQIRQACSLVHTLFLALQVP
ncbi:hypothetical protein CRG98_037732 [Punica granatum]|uniref:Uncharacterized protein n=1 Tax=Punica granatum TaxID=22663 RepID=A0A2I0ICZ7_PUNGR|nr:hypothetical protein CRG98_037732 [Punica granatum]